MWALLLSMGLSVGKGSSEQGGNSLLSFTRSYCTKTKVSGTDCEALKLMSIPTKRPNMFHYVNQMQWVVHKCWLLSARLICLLVMKGEMGKSSESVHLIKDGYDSMYNELSNPYLQFSEGLKRIIFSDHRFLGKSRSFKEW